ncbi:MAG TPA: hypothetical protein VLC52_04060, partial [Anaerolineae bacterium]|nr:hypothetical protein [Anaerolineae bacterium]
MERWLIIELAAGIVGSAFLAFLGWLMQHRKKSGAILVGSNAAAGSALCILGTLIGRQLGENTGGWIGLLAGMVLSAVLFPPRLAGFAKAKSRMPFVLAWVGLCVLCVIGYLLGDWPGLAMVPLTTVVIMLWLLYRFSKHVLPVHDVESDRVNVFRCVLTFLLGTNWTFYFVKDGKTETRVKGNAFRQFFAGPGFVYVEPDHAAYVTDSVTLTGIGG